MRHMREDDTVKVVRLLAAGRRYDGTESVARAPAVGDVACVCHEYAPANRKATVAVEMLDDRGSTIWLDDFEREELELVE